MHLLFSARSYVLASKPVCLHTQVCPVCGERIDFRSVNSTKIGQLSKQGDHTRVWKPRWFQLYGNHLVYWSGMKEDVDILRARGVIHLCPETRPVLLLFLY